MISALRSIARWGRCTRLGAAGGDGARRWEREALWYRLRTLNTPLVPQAVSLIDIALWDMAARQRACRSTRCSAVPATRCSAYASTPLLADADRPTSITSPSVSTRASRRSSSIAGASRRATCRCARRCTAFPGTGLAFMLDVEQRYDRGQRGHVALPRLGALRLSWFEAPLLDTDLVGYRSCAGAAPCRSSRRQHLARPADAVAGVRLDAPGARSASTPRSAAASRRCARSWRWPRRTASTCELQCWGYTLTQAANLHVMLAYGNCTYFEQPAPYPAFEYGTDDVIRTDARASSTRRRGRGWGSRRLEGGEEGDDFKLRGAEENLNSRNLRKNVSRETSSAVSQETSGADVRKTRKVQNNPMH